MRKLDMKEFNVAYDLGIHAGQNASEAIVRVADTANSTREAMCITSVALAYVMAKINAMAKIDPNFGFVVEAMSKAMADMVNEAVERERTRDISH